MVWIALAAMALLESGEDPYELVERRPPGRIQIMVPYWIYSRVSTFLTAIQSSGKPKEYLISILEGHARRLNL